MSIGRGMLAELGSLYKLNKYQKTMLIAFLTATWLQMTYQWSIPYTISHSVILKKRTNEIEHKRKKTKQTEVNN